jgi:phosphoadenosine phosphosulfate reductase
MQDLLFGSLVDLTIRRIQTYCQGRQITVAYSGGKDSTVLVDLFRRSGIPYTVIHNVVPFDPPEIHEFVRRQSNVTLIPPKRGVAYTFTDYAIMPTRSHRWCCREYKEARTPLGNIAIGIRWQESTRRSHRSIVSTCNRRPGQFILSPIIDWTEQDVWSYIHDNSLESCSLYREGWRRVGCVLCPLVKVHEAEMARWPKIIDLWVQANHYVFEARKTMGRLRFPDEATQWRWWLSREPYTPEEARCELFDGFDAPSADPAVAEYPTPAAGSPLPGTP